MYKEVNGKLTKRFAYAVGMFPDPKKKKATYLDGCILAALGLKRQKTEADIICFVTPDISKADRDKLNVVFDKVLVVPYISPYKMESADKKKYETILIDKKLFKNCHNYTKEHPYVHVFFKLHIFNPKLFPYEKVCFVDSDLVPLNYYDSLFTIDCPAGFIEFRKKKPWIRSYNWDRCDFIKHGELIPKELTDIDTKSGADINAGLLLIKPDQKQYDEMMESLVNEYDTQNNEFMKEKKQLYELEEHFKKVDEEEYRKRKEEELQGLREKMVSDEKERGADAARLVQAFWKGILQREDYQKQKRGKKGKGGKKGKK